MLRRPFAAVLIAAVVAYAAVSTAQGERGGGRAGFHAGSNQPAVCAVTRPSLQLGRQTETRPGLFLGTLTCLPTETTGLEPSSGWVRTLRPAEASLPASLFSCSARSTRGPPGFAF